MAKLKSKFTSASTRSSNHIGKKYVNKPRNKASYPKAYLTPSKQTSKTSKDIYETLASIETQLKKQNSFWRNFAMALVKGLGNAIGATIIFGALIIWAKTQLAPQINEFIEKFQTSVKIEVPFIQDKNTESR